MSWLRRRPSDPREMDRAWRRALRAAVEERWETTETWLERIVEADSDDLDAYHALARLYRRQGAIGRAIRMHQNLLLRSDLDEPARGEAMLELARDFDEGGFVDRAISSYEEVLDRRPRDAELLERLIRLRGDRGDLIRALELVRRLRRHERKTADRLEVDLLLSRARSLHAEGEAAAARKLLKRCLRRDRELSEAWTLLGEIEAERGKDTRALDAWKKAAAAAPERAAPLYPRIEASFAARGRSAEFERFLRGVLEERPNDVVARVALARSLDGRGESAAAMEEIRRAIEVAPGDLGLRVELGRRLLATGPEAEALKAYEGLLERIEREQGRSTGKAIG
ncbi:MAG TPA: tetratricopeptide repeat protein [Myxococcota bacterium]|nr:tetratricopeptide repeat protein [Myxococcota bacterium]